MPYTLTKKKEKDFLLPKSYPELSTYFLSWFGEKGKEKVLLNYNLSFQFNRQFFVLAGKKEKKFFNEL